MSRSLVKQYNETNFITLKAVKKSITVIDGKITIDRTIISPRNPKDLEKILKSIQKKYESGYPIDKICEKLHFLFNWSPFEFIPMNESLEKYLYLESYYSKMLTGEPDYKTQLSLIKRMIRTFEK